MIALSKKADLDTFMVESDLIVPIEIASSKCEYAARTIRPKLLKLKDAYLKLFEIPELMIKKPHNGFLIPNIYTHIKTFNIDHKVTVSPFLKGGETEAFKHLKAFIKQKLNAYKDSNDPTLELNSYLSPYLHFGAISPIRIYMEVLDASHKNIDPESVESFLEQLLVRRELAFNFIYYHEGYDRFETMTDPWAHQTMLDHENDEREYIYTIKDYESLNTHDIYFNQAMKQMITLGIMPNYMRMYWGKKIIEWSKTYKEAYETTLYLNNKYFLDGRDANSYTGVAWLFGRHDRAWTERKIFGKLRYMNQNGLIRKFDMKKYVEDV
jgi:deoxyribodipyrimidine photo-lyase